MYIQVKDRPGRARPGGHQAEARTRGAGTWGTDPGRVGKSGNHTDSSLADVLLVIIPFCFFPSCICEARIRQTCLQNVTLSCRYLITDELSHKLTTHSLKFLGAFYAQGTVLGTQFHCIIIPSPWPYRVVLLTKMQLQHLRIQEPPSSPSLAWCWLYLYHRTGWSPGSDQTESPQVRCKWRFPFSLKGRSTYLWAEFSNTKCSTQPLRYLLINILR